MESYQKKACVAMAMINTKELSSIRVPLKVAMITCWYRHLSMADHALKLRNGLEEQGVQVHIVTAPCYCQTKEMNDLNYRLASFPPLIKYNTRNRFLSLALLGTMLILQFLRGINYFSKSKDQDIIHYQQSSYSFGIAPLVALLLIPSSKKRIVTLHAPDLPQWLGRHLYRFYRYADCIIVHSEGMARWVAALGVPKAKVWRVFLGTTIPPLQGLTRKEVTFFGAPREEKGISTVLGALRIMNEKKKEAILHIYGIYSERERNETITKAQKLSVERNLSWGGQLSDEEFDKKMQESLVTLVVYSSFVSGSSILTRAMANGVPIIASKIGGLPEYLGNAGILIQPNDSSALAEQILRVIDNNDLQDKLAHAARDRAIKFFDWKSIAEKTIDIYRECFRQHNS